MNNTITIHDMTKSYEYIKQIIDKLMEDFNIRYKTSSDSPNTYIAMKQYYDDNSEFLVYNGGDHGLLGQEYNIKFRALHDFMHVFAGLTFKYDDEKELSRITALWFSDIAWHNLGLTSWECYVIRSIINAEIRGQIEYYETNKKYVEDQSKFIFEYLGVDKYNAVC